ncbi:MAG: Holliday junction branch migration protein RuvA [Gammaproteobacteria bacterium]|nr:Holliday junction branch migration protein RuvA [Gammaproteobacteria bacterium]
MIAFLSGTLIFKQAPNIIIDVQGVGYELLVPMSTYYSLPELSNKLSLYCYQHVREDSLLLFGFTSLDERKLFTELLKANGVGPRMALTILSNYQVSEFINIIETCDSGALVKLPGVGKKTADRLLLELRDRLKTVFNNYQNNPNITKQDDNTADNNLDSTVSDAIAALEALGYKSNDARRVVTKLVSHNSVQSHQSYNSSMLIKAALQEFR